MPAFTTTIVYIFWLEEENAYIFIKLATALIDSIYDCIMLMQYVMPLPTGLLNVSNTRINYLPPGKHPAQCFVFLVNPCPPPSPAPGARYPMAEPISCPDPQGLFPSSL